MTTSSSSSLDVDLLDDDTLLVEAAATEAVEDVHVTLGVEVGRVAGV
jgi:hypothetical protein